MTSTSASADLSGPTTTTADPATTNPSTALRRLRLVLNANAASSFIGGAIAVAAAPWISEEFGIDHVAITRAVGAGLILFAAFVAWVARQPDHTVQRESLAISAGDAAWVIATIVVVATGILTTTGVVVAIALAVMVGDFGAMQFLLRRRSLADR